MMLSGVLAKTVRDRWLAFVGGPIVIGLLLIGVMAVYAAMDLRLIRDLPEAFLALAGITPGAGPSALAYNIMYGLMGAMTIAGLAIWIGAGSIAGEERAGTLALLLANPISRTHVLVAKAAAMVVLTVLGGVILAAFAVASPTILGTSLGGADPGALVVHMTVNAMFYGFLALAIGGWTGNGGLAAGVTAGVMIVSYLAVGLLPLIEGLGNLVRIFPWYYFDGSRPLVNGIERTDLAGLLVGCVLFLLIAIAGVDRRDLRNRGVGRTMVDRLRASRWTRAAMNRLAGSAGVSHIWTRTVSEHQALVLVIGLLMAAAGVMYGVLYASIPRDVLQFGARLPKELLALIGYADMSTPQGWYQSEYFSLEAPIVMLLISILVGARALAGEEGDRTMGLLLANPVRRSRVVLEKAAAMALLTAAVGLVIILGALVGSTIGGLGLDAGDVAAASLLAMMLGLSFGGLALVLGAATGRVSVAVEGSVGLALAAYVINSFLPLSDSLAGWARVSPFYYYLTGNPLANGIDWTHLTLLAGLFLGSVALSVVLFEHRDLRQPA